MGQTAQIWEGLLQRVVEANQDIVGGKRLKGHLDRLAERYPALRKVTVTEGGKIALPEDFPEDDAGLMTVCTILGALYWALDMFTGPANAAERVRRPAREYIATLLPGTVLGLNKFLPKLQLEGPDTEGATDRIPGIDDETEEEEGEEGTDDSTDVVPRALFPGEPAESPPVSGAGGEEAARTDEAAGLPGEEPAAMFSGTVPWLDERVPRGCSLLVEGAGRAKERFSLRFLKEGLEAGEPALALIAFSPEEFRERMAAEGLDTAKAEQEGRLKILDWSTFRERHIEDLEDEGAVMRLPMELPYVGSGMNIAMQNLPEGGSPRAFVNILPRALATVAIETVFNFVQVTILKFRKRDITALFIMDEEKDPEKAAIRLSFNSWVELQETEQGKLRARFGGPLLSHKIKVLVPSDEGLTVESEEAFTLEEPAPELTSSLLRRLDEWRSQGYQVAHLEEALRGSPSKAKAVFEGFEKSVERARILRNELKILDLSGLEAYATEIREMLNDVQRVDEAEEALGQLRVRIERKKQGTVLVLGKEGGLTVLARPAEALPVQDAELPAEGPETVAAQQGPQEEGAAGTADGETAPALEGGITPEGLAEEEKRREFREALDRWKEEGYDVRTVEEALASDLDSARRSFLLFRVQLQRLREMGDELGTFVAPALAGRRAELVSMLKDVSNIPQLENGLEELRSEADRLKDEDRARKEGERQRRAQLAEKVFWWSSHGLVVDRLEAALSAGELAALEKEVADFEPKAQRLLRLKGELAALDATDFKEEAAALDSKLGDAERMEETEAELEAFKEHLALHSRDAKARRQLREKLDRWRDKGFRVEALERLLEREHELPALESEFDRFAASAESMTALSERLAGMEVAGFEQRAEELRRKLKDPSLLEECRRGMLRLQEDIARARVEEKERAACRARIGEWRKAGLQTDGLEALLDKDMGALKWAMVEFQFEIQIYDELVQLLEPLLRSSNPEAAQLQKDLRDFSRLPELEEKVLALRAKLESEAVESGKELYGELERDMALLEKLQSWINSGYHVRRLESTLKGDAGTLRAEAERLERDIDQLSKTASALEVLDTKGLERELAHIRSMLDDPDKLPAVRALTESLRTEIGRRKKEEERRLALRAVASEWEKKGYDTSTLHAALRGDLEKASQEFILFHTTLAAAEDLRRRLDLLEVFGLEEEVEALRKKLRDPRALEEVRVLAEGLWKSADEKGRERVNRLKATRQRRAALKERLAVHMKKGMAVARLEKALELPPEQAEAEFARFDEDVHLLAALEKRLEPLAVPGLEGDILSLRSMMNDVDRLREVEEGVGALETRVERARREQERRKEEVQARKVEEERKLALRRHLEERLNEWSSFGLNVEALRAALEGDAAVAERKFEDFENSLYRTEELRLQLHELQAKGVGDIPGAETVEKLLEDPLRLPQAERAFAEFRQRAESVLLERDTEVQGLLRKIGELREKGEDVSELERALQRGPAEARRVLAEHERHIMKRDLQDTWKGIKSKLVGAEAAPPPANGGGGGAAAGAGVAAGSVEAGARPEGKIIKKKRRKNIKAGG